MSDIGRWAVLVAYVSMVLYMWHGMHQEAVEFCNDMKKYRPVDPVETPYVYHVCQEAARPWYLP